MLINKNTFGSLGVYFSSAVLYSLVPLFVVFGNLPDKSLQFSILIYFLLATFSTIVVIFRFRSRKASFLRLLNWKDFCLNVLNSVSIVLSLYLMMKALASSDKISVVLILETWPILVVLGLPFVRLAPMKKISMRNFVFATISFFGVAIIVTDSKSFADLTQVGFGFDRDFLIALASMVAMCIATLAKSRFVERCDCESDLSFFDVQLVLHAFKLPILVVVLLVMGLDVTDLLFERTQIAGIFFVGVLLFFSSILFSIGYLMSNQASDALVWFFSPVLTIFFLTVFHIDEISTSEVLGAILVISSNLFLNFPAEKGHAFSGGVFAFLVFGTLCFFIPGDGGRNLFAIISSLSIFYVVIVAFLLERAAQRNDEEGRLILQLWEELFSLILRKSKSKFKAESLRTDFTKLVTADSVNQLQKAYWQLLDFIDAPTKKRPVQARLLINQLVLSRNRGVGFAELFALASIAVLTVSATLHYRPPTFFGAIFATVVSFSITFIFLSLMELLSVRHQKIVRFKGHGKHCNLIVVVKAHGEEPEYIRWSVFLILLITCAFIFLFYLKYNG